jgi:hypothetical protein
MPVVGGAVHGASVGHTRSRTQIIPISVIGAGPDEIGEAVQLGGSGVALNLGLAARGALSIGALKMKPDCGICSAE